MNLKLTLLLLLVYAMGYAQPLHNTYNEKITPPPAPVQPSSLRTTAAEICNNGIDDDNNGLTDEKDHTCYFNGFSPTACNPSSVVWGVTDAGDIFWFDMTTGAIQNVGNAAPGLIDITWASNGRLYCVSSIPEGIFEVDPQSLTVKLITSLRPRYTIGNSLTADRSGNLYLTVSTGWQKQIIKYNIATQETCLVADLTPLNVNPAGDLTFLDEMLYLTTSENKLVKIDVRTGAISQQTFINGQPSGLGYFGLVSMSDGFLYVGEWKYVYRVDPATAVVNPNPVLTLPSSSQAIYGLAGYSELCESPYCTAKTSIKASSTPPYCTNLGVLLTGSATPATLCPPTVSSLSWTKPDGTTVANPAIKAFTPGKYYLNYTSPKETCDRVDSFTLVYAPNAPLKVEASYTPPIGCSCTGSMTVTTGCGSGHFSYAWSNGATTATVANICPGNYSVKVTDLDWGHDTTVHITLSAVNPIQRVDITTINEHCQQSDGSITIANIHGGTSPYTFSLNNQPFDTRPEFTSLSDGSYHVTVKDNTGCILQKQVIIQAEPGPEKIWYTKKDAYCGLPAGTLLIDSIKSGAAPYVFSLDNGAFNPQTMLTDITPGARNLTVKDRFGCLLNESFTIYQSEALQITISPKDTTVCASLKVPFRATQSGNNDGVQYSWDQRPFSTDKTFNLPVITDKKMIVQAIDKYGCTAFDSATITAPYCDSLFAKCVLFPNAFTPNRDGLNDTFGPTIGDCEIKKYKMMIYNRWGQLIFQTSDPFQKWNGATNGQLPQGDTYVYTCIWTDVVGVSHSLKGTVVLIR